MRRMTTPVLCFLLGLLMVFVVLVDVSGAAADDDDDDDRPSYRHSEWRHHGHHHGKKHRHHRHGRWHYGDDDENCDYDESYRHAKGHGHGRQGHHQSGRSSDWRYLDDDEIIEIEPNDAAVWRNPDSRRQANPPVRQPQSAYETGSTEVSDSGPCREYHTTARVGGRIQQIYGHACRQPDGSWKFIQ